jgi:O-antigen ligase
MTARTSATTSATINNDQSSPSSQPNVSAWLATAGLHRLHAFSLFAFASCVSFSIAGAHISLALLTLCVTVQGARGKGQKDAEPPRFSLGIEWPIIVFVLLGLISTALSESPFESFRNLRHLLTILGAYAVALSLRWHPEWRRPVLWTFIAVATVAAVYGLGKFALGYSGKVLSTQATTMTWGALSVMFMAVTLQMALAAPLRRDRWLARGLIIPQTFAMLLSLVRGAYVGFAAGAMYLFRQYWADPQGPLSGRRILVRRILPALLVLAIVVAFLSPSAVRQRFALIFDLKYHSTQVRLVQWKYALQISADHPLFGVGWRDMLPIFRRYAPPDINVSYIVKHDIFHIGHFHNTYIMVLACFGVIGLVAFFWLLVAIWRQLGLAAARAGTSQDRIVIYACRAAMVGFLVAGIFDWTFGDAEVVTMFWFLIGMGLGQIGPADLTSQTLRKVNAPDLPQHQAFLAENQPREGSAGIVRP